MSPLRSELNAICVLSGDHAPRLSSRVLATTSSGWPVAKPVCGDTGSRQRSAFCRKIAKGRFTLDLRSGRTNHLLLATVTGIAPFVSYVRTLYQDWKSRNSAMPGEHKLFCLQGGSRSWEFGYREELERVASEVPWFKYVATISRPWEDASWKGETGRVDDLIRKYTDEWNLRPENTTGYLCGHPSMCENGQGILARAGWPKGSTFEEVYFIPGKEASE